MFLFIRFLIRFLIAFWFLNFIWNIAFYLWIEINKLIYLLCDVRKVAHCESCPKYPFSLMQLINALSNSCVLLKIITKLHRYVNYRQLDQINHFQLTLWTSRDNELRQQKFVSKIIIYAFMDIFLIIFFHIFEFYFCIEL